VLCGDLASRRSCTRAPSALDRRASGD
jgi:hypothetical protein